jgi:hypothetical protein
LATAGDDQAVRRALARDDLLMLAAEADRAIGIVRQRETLPRRGRQDATLFDLALEHLLGLAEHHGVASIRAQAWDYAGTLVRFCAMTQAELRPLPAVYTSRELHARALAEVRNLDPASGTYGLDRDLMNGVFLRHHAARDLRLAGRPEEALELIDQPVTEVYGRGADAHLCHFLYEKGANLIALGRAEAVNPDLARWDRHWQDTHAAGFSTRHRVDFVRALAAWEAVPAGKAVREWLAAATRLLAVGGPAGGLPGMLPEDAEPEILPEEQGVRELSVVLSSAEYLAGHARTEADHAAAVALGVRALALADQVRGRWKVLARSRAPLAVAFQRVYGDLALLAQRLDGPGAAELGFRVALSAKQTGFAARIRDGLTFDGNPRIDGIIRQIVEIETETLQTFSENDDTRRDLLATKRFELEQAATAMLADTVFPVPKAVDAVVRTLGGRYALDFIELRDTLRDEPRLFRTLIEPGGRMWFESFETDPGFRERYELGDAPAVGHRGGAGPGPKRSRNLDREAHSLTDDDVDWRALARTLLPERLTAVLTASDTAAPGGTAVKLLISAHSWLSMVPWAALKIDEDGTRLVQRAVVTQTPVLTCLADAPPPPVAGRALIRLVGLDERGVDVNLERQAWGLKSDWRGVPLHACRIPGKPEPTPHPDGRLDKALAQPGAWQFLHIAAHGKGKNFDQRLAIPGERLSAARALSLKWPTSVLMASCDVGLLINDTRAEPLNLVTAVLTGGAHCVVAGIASVEDTGTGRAAAHMVRAVRDPDTSVTLGEALRDAQLEAIGLGVPERGWALLSAYSR